MNAMVGFNANQMGHLSPTRAKRQQAWQQISSNLRAQLFATQSTEAKAAAQKGNSLAAAGGDDMDRNAFLQMLMMQMQNQDPMEPVDNTAMLAQLAQFSSLEQMTNLNTSFTGMQQNLDMLAGNVDQLNFINAQGLLGRHVEGVNADGAVVRGEVEAVHLDGSIVVLTVGGKPMPMTGVMAVSTDPLPEPPAEGGAES